jgi:hypothetical protein
VDKRVVQRGAALPGFTEGRGEFFVHDSTVAQGWEALQPGLF